MDKVPSGFCRGERRWALFECHRCGRCCIELPYDPRSLHEIAAARGLGWEELLQKHYGEFDGKYFEFDDSKRRPCPFLSFEDSGKAMCAIYEVRPEGCRLYPFDTDFGRQDVDCPSAAIVYKKLKQDDG